MKYKKCLTTGVFDVIHYAHLNIFRKGADIAEKLIVAIQEDESVFKAKGNYPILSSMERKKTLELIPYIDKVIIYDGTNKSLSDLSRILKKVNPDVILQGDDWPPNSADGTRIVNYFKKKNIDIVLVPYTKEISTSEMKKRIVAQEKKNNFKKQK